MIDLHCHLLPSIDDGAKNLTQSIAMARMAVQDGIVCTACTPHVYPGVYENTAEGIKTAVVHLQTKLQDAGIALQLAYGADTHLVPEMLKGLRSGRIPTLNSTRYFLLEPSHHAHPPQFANLIFNVIASGYVPLITHPERLTWAEDHYDDFVQAVEQGAWIQITAGSLTGRFGRSAKHLAEQMLDDGIVHILATDAHDTSNRAPRLAEGRDAAAKWVGAAEAERMVEDRPKAVLANADPKTVMPALTYQDVVETPMPRSNKGGGFWKFFGLHS